MNKQIEFQEKLTQNFKNSNFTKKTLVFGEGADTPVLMMIGEAPGGDEEKQGRPFVGKAGKNLSSFLEVIGLQREEIYITNVVKLRPTKDSPKTGKAVNRPPSKEEISFFLPYLKEEIQLISPKVIVTLGNVPLKAVTDDKGITIGDVHGKPYSLEQTRVLFPLYHPAAIIYNRGLTNIYQQDLLVLKELLRGIK
ncbi:uracil-DNA glycosylase [Anaerotignum sp.]|uniref:uracil-DNA glycosylase n=1 Tax=Anaerotignum sp. TaxID=2039241 RepID=UPI003320C7E0